MQDARCSIKESSILISYILTVMQSNVIEIPSVISKKHTMQDA